MQKIPRRDNNGINKYRKKNMYPKAKKKGGGGERKTNINYVTQTLYTIILIMLFPTSLYIIKCHGNRKLALIFVMQVKCYKDGFN
jgi:hypothetical protein